MDPGLQAALPFAATAALSILVSPAVDKIVRIRVEDWASNQPEPKKFGEMPSDLADLVSWGVDQYQLFALIVVTPLLGVVFGRTIHSNLVIAGYVACTVITLLSYVYVASKHPSVYVSTGKLNKARATAWFFKKVPLIGGMSIGLAASVFALGVSAVVAALTTPPATAVGA